MPPRPLLVVNSADSRTGQWLSNLAEVPVSNGSTPPLRHSAMEACDSYRPWHDKTTGKTFVRPDSGKCLLPAAGIRG